MKMVMKKAVVLLMVVAMLLGIPGATAYADGYTCSDYSDCTRDGADIYVVTKDNCPIREEANNSGKIVARAQVGDLVSVTDVFWTIKCAKWCEIQTNNGTYYIYSENLKQHTKHEYAAAYDNNKGIILNCSVCGYIYAEAKATGKTCGLKCVADHAVKGSFSEYDSTFVSVISEIVAAEFLGPIADVRDFIGDIRKGEDAWVIALDVVALLPLVGILKYSDEVASLKYVDDVGDAGKSAAKIHWGLWSEYKHTVVNGKECAEVGSFYYYQHAVEEFMNPSFMTNQQLNKAGKLVEHSRGIPPSAVEYVLTDGVKDGSTALLDTWTHTNGLTRQKFRNGNLEVILEEGNTVVTMYIVK